MDKYKNYAELRANEREGLDFRICVSNRAVSVAVIAPVCTENLIRIDWGEEITRLGGGLTVASVGSSVASGGKGGRGPGSGGGGQRD